MKFLAIIIIYQIKNMNGINIGFKNKIYKTPIMQRKKG